MPIKVFISYSSQDRDKADLLYDALSELNDKFEPIIIDKTPTPDTTLSEKVQSGITNCSYLIPIITKRSIYNQWVNQEIGFAYAKSKAIIPLVERHIMKNLKGFIHDQIDLSFNFKSSKFLKKREAQSYNQLCCTLIDYIKKILLADFSSNISPLKVKQGEKYTTQVKFKGYVKNGFFDNYVEHLGTSWYQYNWDPSTLRNLSPNPRAAGELHGNVDIERSYTHLTHGWPTGKYIIHVRVYDHRVPGKVGRIPIAEENHPFEVV
ncbi:toll/interleukin-1 receptor domain-containing protein [candidate division KSB1 bacterium]|nr:toll/interleukin-1 receptor domain-containing protein [candidate division KSB1 bacterium]